MIGSLRPREHLTTRRSFLQEAGAATIAGIGLPLKKLMAQDEFTPPDPFNRDRPDYTKPEIYIPPKKPTEAEINKALDRAVPSICRVEFKVGKEMVSAHSGFLAQLDPKEMADPRRKDKFFVTCAHGESETREILKSQQSPHTNTPFDLWIQLPGMNNALPIAEIYRNETDVMVLRIDPAHARTINVPGIPFRDEYKNRLVLDETVIIKGAHGEDLPKGHVTGTLRSPMQWATGEEAYRGHSFGVNGAAKSGMSGGPGITFPFAAAGVQSAAVNGKESSLMKIGEAKQLLRANGVYKKLQ